MLDPARTGFALLRATDGRGPAFLVRNSTYVDLGRGTEHAGSKCALVSLHFCFCFRFARRTNAPTHAPSSLSPASTPSTQHRHPQGGSPTISRQHARISWDAAAAAWVLTVQGKNGVLVDGNQVGPADPPRRLGSRAALAIGDRHLAWHGPAPGWPVLTGDGRVVLYDEEGGGAGGDG
jgi:hypothetical protein